MPRLYPPFTLACPRCQHRWQQAADYPDRTCPECYRKARKRAANSMGPGTSHEVAVASCIKRDAVGVSVKGE